MSNTTRRKFLAAGCTAVAGGAIAALGLPSLGLIVAPATKRVVVAPTGMLDVGAVASFTVGAPPQRVDVIAAEVRDAWSSSRDVALGAAWISRPAPDKIVAFSGVCPHLGCAIGWDANSYLCPCHDSRFGVDGEKLTGPSERGLDPLPVQIRDNRLELTWIKYKLGTSRREPA